MKKILMAGILAAVLVSAVPAGAVQTELALMIDGSSSIVPADFDLQKAGYMNALNEVLADTDGSVAVGVWQFSSVVIIPWIKLEHEITVIDSETALEDLLLSISAMDQIAGLTPIDTAIDTAADALLNNDILGTRMVIDVSTDGRDTMLGDPVQSALDAVAAGVTQVNALMVGVTPGDVDEFDAGIGSFTHYVDDYEGFEDAIREKLEREVYGLPDGGATILLLGLAMTGIGAMRRK